MKNEKVAWRRIFDLWVLFKRKHFANSAFLVKELAFLDIRIWEIIFFYWYRTPTRKKGGHLKVRQ